MSEIKHSEKIELVLQILEQCKKDYKWYCEQLDEENNKRTDILHEIEGAGIDNTEPPNYDQRAVLATKLQNVLIARRVAKDGMYINAPIFDLFDSEPGAKTLNKLREALGEIRKREDNKEQRKYGRRAEKWPPENPALDKLIRDWKKSSRSR